LRNERLIKQNCKSIKMHHTQRNPTMKLFYIFYAIQAQLLEKLLSTIIPHNSCKTTISKLTIFARLKKNNHREATCTKKLHKN